MESVVRVRGRRGGPAKPVGVARNAVKNAHRSDRKRAIRRLGRRRRRRAEPREDRVAQARIAARRVPQDPYGVRARKPHSSELQPAWLGQRALRRPRVGARELEMPDLENELGLLKLDNVNFTSLKDTSTSISAIV